MKYVKLISAAYVNGALRHPHEGALHVEDAEAKRLIDSGVADDASDGFSAAQLKDAPTESVSITNDQNADGKPAGEHQALAPATPAGRKPAAKKDD